MKSKTLLDGAASFALLAVAFLATASGGFAEVVNYTWAGLGDGAWEAKANWSPAYPGGSAIGASTHTRYDRVTISGPVTVTRTGNVEFHGLGAGGEKAGAFDVITLNNGAHLVINGSLRVSTASGAPNTAVRSVFIGAGSSLVVTGDLTTGVQNSTSAGSTWTINGSVTAQNFIGQQNITSKTPGINGGYTLSLAGGSLTVTDTFDWASGGGTRTDTRGQINLSAGGSLTVATMNDEWTASTGNIVLFLDGTGSLTFGKANYATRDRVQALIDGDRICLGEGLGGRSLVITDLGSQWRVSVSGSR